MAFDKWHIYELLKGNSKHDPKEVLFNTPMAEIKEGVREYLLMQNHVRGNESEDIDSRTA